MSISQIICYRNKEVKNTQEEKISVIQEINR